VSAAARCPAIHRHGVITLIALQQMQQRLAQKLSLVARIVEEPTSELT
jgi:hypothetical protein